MKTSRLTPSLFAAACVTLLVTVARADESSNTIKFSNPGKPGTVKLSLGHGDLTVVGSDTNEVTIKTDMKAASTKPRKDGLRVISDARGFALSEKDNVVTIDSAARDWGRSGGDFQLTVPRNTTVIVQNAWNGGVTCKNISGDIEINSMNGEIKLEDVSGGVVAGTMHGEIRASIRELHEGKPLSFTTMNGEVQLRLPETTKATVRLRTQNGAVLTDFDESALVTKTETSAGFPRGKAFMIGPGKSKVISAEVEDAIREATRLSATAVKEALEAVKQGLQDSEIETDEARRKLDDARREIDKARRDAERARRDAERSARNESRPGPEAPEARPAPAAVPKPPTVPKIAIVPTITGGKLVTGTLNGGGPEISVSTMNGDVILRKLEQK